MKNNCRVFILVYFYWGIVSSQETSYNCNPEADCKAAAAGVLVPDPSDCERYYVCLLSGTELIPSSEPLRCPQNEYFNQTTGQCEAEVTAGICVNVCRDIGICATKCQVPSTTTTFVADQFDCGIYYICDGMNNYTGRCPSNVPYFNGATCVSDKSQCCMCTPYCPTPLLQIQDPCDCTAYYFCLSRGQPHDVNRVDCQEGSYFNETTNHCTPGSCTSSCSNCMSAETTQPPTTTTTTTLPTTTPGDSCLNDYNCPTDGVFPRCNYCDPSYFYCKGGNATIEYCSGGTVFNPSIQYPYCIPPENCPF